ncbi:uncharacterized protein si:ch211-67e16.4 [Nothobranchius furzeri]|uniref:Transcript variant X1 n=4 Tax=Nothobranchius TaxID=28779 RepID=A0A1A7ZDA0_NOTFU|nr:transcript variant X1 [Nothobranchius furzeri]KAF7218055.1 transcript variant X2 [Nothobranchius furzeri]
MDVSIAVSLIRGQMGAVVERAVNTAVETVLAEMLKVVGVKFEELKSQVVLMKRDVVALQREKALKEKENDNIRAKLRYTELKLKYYRQGVEEELQQRASAPSLIRIQPSTFTLMQKGEASNSPTEPSAQRTAAGTLLRSSQECTSPEISCRKGVRGHCSSGVGCSDSSELLSFRLAVDTPPESTDSNAGVFCRSEPDGSLGTGVEQENEWTISDGADDDQTSSPVQPPSEGAAQHPAPVPQSYDASAQADSIMLPPSAPKVKQEEEEEVICIKEEPEEEQEVVRSLLLDCQAEQSCASGSEVNSLETEPSRPPAGLMNSGPTFSSAGSGIYTLPQLTGLFPSSVVLPSGIQARQATRSWSKDLSLYEEYKLRRTELRHRNLSRRRELEKALPQPLLADLVRERREKTRLRVARWRAKRKLQACLNQNQVHDGTAGLSQASFPANSLPQQLRAPCASTSSSHQRENSAAPQSSSYLSNISANSTVPVLRLIPSSQSQHGPDMAPHEHAVTSSCSYPRISQSLQGISHSEFPTELPPGSTELRR